MGFFDNLKNISREAKRQAKKKSKEIKEELDEEFGDEQLYKDAKEITKSTINEGKNLSKSVAKEAGEIQKEFGDTDLGKSIGEISRSISSRLSQLPVFSLTADTVKGKNGVDKLYKHLAKDPNDPERYIWLAEAIMRTRLDMKHYSRIRSTVDPSYYMVKTSVKSLNSLGELEKDPTTIKLLKKAFMLSLEAIEENTRDHKALYCLGRIYFCQGDIPEATKYSKLSFLARTNALALITLGKCYLNLDQLANAKKAAKRALAFNSTYSYKILAECKMLDKTQDNSIEKIESYANQMNKIAPKHRAAYLGPSGDTINILEGIGKKQWQRLLNLME